MWPLLLLQIGLPGSPPEAPLPQVTPVPIVQVFQRADLEALSGPKNHVVLEPPGPAHSVGFWCKGDLEGAEVGLFTENAEPHSVWTLQLAPDLNHGSKGPAGEKQVYSLVHGPVSHPLKEIHLLLPHFSKVQQLTVVWIPVGGVPGVSLPQSGSGAGPTTSLPKPPVSSRSSWGAAAAQCSPSYCTTTHISMHHTASASEYASPGWAQCAANVQATQTYHMVTRGWCDIGYNYLICPHGDIFEGRGGGDDVRGAHDGFNCGSMGVAMMGYFHTPHDQVLTQPMRDAFVALAGWKCDQQDIDPLGSSWYAGLGGVEENLYGHRDVSSTACPGDLAYAELPNLRLQVDQLIQGGSGTTLILDNGQASFVGNWTTGTSSPDKYGSDYRWVSSGVAPARALWTPNLSQAGNYQVSLWWPAGSNRNPATQVGLLLNGQLFTTTVDQQVQGGQWNVLGTVQLPAGSSTTLGITNQGPTGWVVVADALRLVRQ